MPDPPNGVVQFSRSVQVYVIGEVGKGRVLFSGCYYGYRGRLQGAEKDAVLGLTAWLAGAGR